MIHVPEGSLYFWCYEEGLKHHELDDVINAVRSTGRELRPKDVQNYWNGWYRSDLYTGQAPGRIWSMELAQGAKTASNLFPGKSYLDYPDHPYLEMPEVEKRWVPCNQDNKPMIPWSDGCMLIEDARAKRNARYLAENMKGTKMIVVDCDGDHTDDLDFKAISFLSQFREETHCLSKPKLIPEYDGYEHLHLDIPASFHLTFAVDRLIPTMHFPEAGMDIIGNAGNSLRYRKNKTWNHVQPAEMTPEIWDMLRSYVERRRS